MDEASRAILTVSGILFGFFFAAFWWILNRELTFNEDQRHFKPATGVLMASMALVAVFGIILPLRHAALTSPSLWTSYRGILLALVAIYGYMFIELAHYGIFQRPKYMTRAEKVFILLTVLVLFGLATRWWLLP